MRVPPENKLQLCGYVFLRLRAELPFLAVVAPTHLGKLPVKGACLGPVGHCQCQCSCQAGRAWSGECSQPTCSYLRRSIDSGPPPPAWIGAVLGWAVLCRLAFALSLPALAMLTINDTGTCCVPIKFRLPTSREG